MTRSELIEVCVISVVAATSWMIAPHIASPMPLWQIVLGVAGLLLLQSLVRDVAILTSRRHPTAAEPRKEAQCFCLESTVGLTGVLAGAILAGLGSDVPVSFGPWSFFLGVLGTMVLSFLLKDWVVAWNPPGLRREKNHLNLIPRWKIKTKP